jgi:hypothetical protein
MYDVIVNGSTNLRAHTEQSLESIKAMFPEQDIVIIPNNVNTLNDPMEQ